MLSPIGFPVFSNQHLLRLTQDQKGLLKACNGVECKGMSQRDAKSSYIVYVTLFGLIVAAHSCLFDYKHSPSH
ncbi:hypothetical protein H5410_027369, partial [Solanum commersonii]